MQVARALWGSNYVRDIPGGGGIPTSRASLCGLSSVVLFLVKLLVIAADKCFLSLMQIIAPINQIYHQSTIV